MRIVDYEVGNKARSQCVPKILVKNIDPWQLPFMSMFPFNIQLTNILFQSKLFLNTHFLLLIAIETLKIDQYQNISLFSYCKTPIVVRISI